MTSSGRVGRGVLAILMFMWAAPLAGRQQRAPNGEVYRELQPFVGLRGVRFDLRGLDRGVWNTPPGTVGDPETRATGLSRVAHEQLDEAITADTEELAPL